MKKNSIILLVLFICSFSFSQPTQVLDINIGNSSSNPSNLFVHNGLIFFSADDSGGINTPGGMDLGREIWVSDGTSGGTIFFKDLNNGSSSSSPNNFFLLNGNLYFSAISGSENTLFTTDGTELGTQATTVSMQLNSPVELGGTIYFVNATDRRLYEFNGTASNPVAGSGNEYIQDYKIKAFDGKLFCYMNTSTQIGTVGTELYAYDPTLDSFQLIKDIGGGQLDSDLLNFTVLGTELYFTAFSELELWKTDGTEIGTVGISAASPISNFDNLYGWNERLFLEGDNQLWVYNPALDSVTNLSNLTGAFPNHDPSDYVELDGWLYYRGEDSNDNDGHLWRTDGSSTFQLDDTIINVDDIVALNDKLYFEGSNGTDGNELFEFDPASLSIDEFSNIDKISVYPNPTSEFINIKSSTPVNEIELRNMLGQLILKTDQEKINISVLQSGTYLIKIITDKERIIKKIVVSRSAIKG
ncbi:MAG: T9SS type A sorting domain-containing protein [Gelidibacter sp.]